MKRRKKKPEARVLGYDMKDPAQKEELIAHMSKEYQSGRPMKEILEVPQQLLDNVYAMAYEKYQKGEYARAADYFRYLVIFDEHCYKYILGLAACLHKQGEFGPAAQTYLLAALHNPEDPVPNFHGADCYLKIGEEEVAHAALRTAVHVSGSQEKYAELKARAELMIENLENKWK